MATSKVTEDSFVNEAKACRLFSSSFYKAVTGELGNENIISSPLSVHILLSYLTHGAKGRTLTEMITGLSITDAEQLHIGYKSLMASLNGTAKADLLLSNSVFFHNDVKLQAVFSSIGADYYDFKLSKLDFKNNVHSAGEINDWVVKKTNGKIKDLITPDEITDDTKIILVNAIYFKGSWEFPFDAQRTSLRDFHVTKDIVKKAPIMVQKRRYRHGDLPNIKAKYLEMPYSDENLSMIIILPDEIDGLSTLEQNFNWTTVLTADHSHRETILHLPKFKIECKMNLKEILEKMGFVAMFKDLADFSGISDEPLKVSKVVQKAFVEVNEEGTEAAAATNIQMRLRRMADDPDEFNVDRPFMVVIRHKPSDMPLFIGSVRDIGDITTKDEL